MILHYHAISEKVFSLLPPPPRSGGGGSSENKGWTLAGLWPQCKIPGSTEASSAGA